jgi:hypothetical protein
MGKLVLTDAFVSIDGNDVSDHVKSVTINYSADLQDSTAMGDGSHTRVGGLKDWSLDVDFHQDYAAANVDALMFPLVGTSFPVIVRPVKTGGVGAGNPNYTGTAIMESYKPITGSVGDLAETSVSIPGNGTLSRAVS